MAENIYTCSYVHIKVHTKTHHSYIQHQNLVPLPAATKFWASLKQSILPFSKLHKHDVIDKRAKT